MKKILLSTMICFTASVSAATQTCSDTIQATTPTSRFTINADNTVTDKQTGLTWMRCSLGQTGSDCSGGEEEKYKWSEVLNEVKDNYPDWRIPTMKELASIVEKKCKYPAINLEVFPNTHDSDYIYWSSSPFDNGGGYDALGIGFSEGRGVYYYKKYDGYVRLVRTGQ